MENDGNLGEDAGWEYKEKKKTKTLMKSFTFQMK